MKILHFTKRARDCEVRSGREVNYKTQNLFGRREFSLKAEARLLIFEAVKARFDEKAAQLPATYESHKNALFGLVKEQASLTSSL